MEEGRTAGREDGRRYTRIRRQDINAFIEDILIREGNHEGIRRQGKNSWQIQIYTGSGPDGKPQRRFMTVHGSKGDAEKKRNELLVSLAKGVPVPVNRRTVADQWHDWVNGAAKAKAGTRTMKAISPSLTVTWCRRWAMYN